MRLRNTRCRVLLVAMAITLLSAPVSQYAHAGKPKKGGGGSSYDLIVLETVTGYARGVNQANEIVGRFIDSDGFRKPVYWTVSAGEVASLPLSLGTTAFAGVATDITDQQGICGYLFDDSTHSASVWPDALAEPVTLPFGAFGEQSLASAINENGVVVGFLWGADKLAPFATAWGVREDGTFTDPLILGPGGAEDVNAGNLVVGQSDNRAFRWQLDWDGTTLTLVSADEVFDPVTFPSSTVDAVNDFGDLCGDRYVPNIGSRFAYLVDDSLSEYTLEPLVDNRRTYTQNDDADSVNNANPPQVVGVAQLWDRATDASQGQRPVLWQGNSVVDLSKATGGGKNSTQIGVRPMKLNDAGWIVGEGYHPNGNEVPIVLIPAQQ